MSSNFPYFFFLRLPNWVIYINFRRLRFSEKRVMSSITQICIRIFKDKKEKGKKRWEKYCYVPSGTRPFPPVGNLHMTNLSVRLPIFSKATCMTLFTETYITSVLNCVMNTS